MPAATGTKSGVPISIQPYHCTLKSVTEEQDSEYGPQWKWVFEVASGSEKGVEIFGWCNDCPPTPNSKKGKWLGMLEGESCLPVGKQCNTDDYIGRQFDVIVSENEKQTSTRVDKFAPLKDDTPF